jgi:hypothetical protein
MCLLNLAINNGVPSCLCNYAKMDPLVTEEGPFIYTYPSLMSDWIFNFYLIQFGTIVQLDGDGISDGALFRIMIFGAEPLVFYATDLGTKLVYARVGSRLVGANKSLDCPAHITIDDLLALRCQLAKDERVSNHVADSMVSIREVVQWTLFVNDPDSSFLSPDDNTLDIAGTLAHLLEFAIQDVSSLYSSLSVEFSRVRDLEENVLHDVLSVWALELEWTTLEEYIIEAPSLGG